MSIEELTKGIKKFYDNDTGWGNFEILSVQERPDEVIGDSSVVGAYEVKSHVWHITTDMYGNDIGAPCDYDFNCKELFLVVRNTGEIIGRKRTEGLFPFEKPEDIFLHGWDVLSDCFQGRV